MSFTKEDLVILEKTKAEWLEYKNTQEYSDVFYKTNPLVSTVTSTFNRPELVINRCLSSILKQTYKNIEIIIVGDNCSPEIDAKIRQSLSSINDPRIKYTNLEGKPFYQEHPNPGIGWRGTPFHSVAGTRAQNHALQNASGDFVTHLDDDDEYMENRIEELLNACMSNKSDLAFHPFLHFSRVNDSHGKIANGNITTSAIFYHKFFKRIECDAECYNKYGDPGDWNRISRMMFMEPQTTWVPKVMTRLY